MGSVTAYKTATGTRYRVRYRKPDRSQTDKRGFTTKRDAREFLATVEVSKMRGEYIDPTEARTTVGDLATPWLDGKRSALKPSSYVPVEAAWRNWVAPTWADVPVGHVRHSDVQRWIASIDKSPSVVLRAHGVLAGILDVAARDRRIPMNPARDVDLPRKASTRARRYLTHAELWAVAEHSGAHRALVLTLGYCGLRWGEAVALRVSDVHFLRRRINVARNVVEVGGSFHEGTPKSHEQRQVPVPRSVLDELSTRCLGRSAGDLIFDDGHGGYMRRTRASQGSRSWWKSALDAAGVEPLVLHDLRHTAASLAVASGANVKAIQRMLGHASAAMTLDVYSDLFDDDLEALSARLDTAIATANVGKAWASATA